jgi:hypothetical protein
MSLFDKLRDTKFTSLKFGRDTPGGGTGNEYIASNPSPIASLSAPTFNNAAESHQNRISNLINKTRRGSKFVVNQKGLQLSNTRLEIINTSSSVISSINQRLRLTPAALYNKDNTINQSGALLGEHLDRFDFTSAIGDDIKYSNIVAKNNQITSGKGNRLFDLSVKLGVGRNAETPINRLAQNIRNVVSNITSGLNTITRVVNAFGGNPILNNINNRVNQIGRAIDKALSPTVDQYLGGPNSTNGIGLTTIRRFDYTSNQSKTNILEGLTKTKLLNLNLEYDKGESGLAGLDRLRYQSAGASYNRAIANIPDISRVEIKHIGISQSPVSNDFDKLRKQQKKPIKHFSFSDVVINGESSNYSYYTESIPDDNRVKTLKDIKTDDIGNKYWNVKFDEFGQLKGFDRDDAANMSIVFQLVDPFLGTNLHRIVFPAYINNFKVNSDASWNDISYIGRSENLYTFNKFKRQVSFGFQIPCFNIVQLRERHRALGSLESSLAGKYNGNKLGGIMTRLYLGNYFKGETGIINNISYSIPNESSWDLEEKLAHNIDVSVNFTVIHNQLPTYKREGGFFNTIPNGANYFTNGRGLIEAGATSDAFNKNIPTKFSFVNRRSNNILLPNAKDATIPSDASDGMMSVNSSTEQEPVVASTGIVNQTQFKLETKQEASQAIEAQVLSDQLRNSITTQY